MSYGITNAFSKTDSANKISNKNLSSSVSQVSLWAGSEQEYNQYEMSSWKNWKTDTSVSQTSTVTAPFNLMGGIYFNGVKLLGGKHVVADNYGFIHYSDDGVTWIKYKIDTNYNDSYFVEYHNGTYYAFTVTTGTITRYSSTDLVNWTSETTDSTQSSGWYDICYVGNRLLAWQGGPSMVASDDDGLHWVNTTPPGGAYSYEKRGVSYVNGIGFYSRNLTNASDFDLWTSNNGATWTQASAISGTNNICSCKIAYGNGIYVMLCSSNYMLYSRTSTDGYTWSDVHDINYAGGDSNTPFSTRNCDITFVNGRFLVAGMKNNTIKYSEDGVNWQQTSCETIGNVVYGFLPVASNNTSVAYSFDSGSTQSLPCPIILVDKKECYTLDSEPTTSTVIYSEPSVESQLTVTSVGVGSITLSDGYVYNRNSGGDADIYRNVGEVHPDYLCFINNVGVKLGSNTIATFN